METKENKQKSFLKMLEEIKDFNSYCIDFYSYQCGIYKIASKAEIKNAINVYLAITDTEKIFFDSIDREEVREIIKQLKSFNNEN